MDNLHQGNGVLIVKRNRFCTDHFHTDQSGPLLFTERSKWQVCDTCHWCKNKRIINLYVSYFPLHLHEWFSCLYRLILCLHGFSPHCPMFSSVLLPGCLRERILYNTFPEIPEVLSCPAEAVLSSVRFRSHRSGHLLPELLF